LGIIITNTGDLHYINGYLNAITQLRSDPPIWFDYSLESININGDIGSSIKEYYLNFDEVTSRYNAEYVETFNLQLVRLEQWKEHLESELIEWFGFKNNDSSYYNIDTLINSFMFILEDFLTENVECWVFKRESLLFLDCFEYDLKSSNYFFLNPQSGLYRLKFAFND
jgi:hypothetical protein